MARDPKLLIDEVATYLQAAGCGTIGTDLFKMQMPGSPVVGSVVYHTGGPNFPGNPTRFITFGVQHRNTRIDSGMGMITRINSVLLNSWNGLSTIRGRITSQGEPGGYYMDSNGHFLLVASFNCITVDQ